MIFFIESDTVDISNYTIKDIPGSTGRLDVISRCVLAALMNDDGFDISSEIWVFLKKYGTFIFNPKKLIYEIFPKNELQFTDYFVKAIKSYYSIKELNNNPLSGVAYIDQDMNASLSNLMRDGYRAHALMEKGINIMEGMNNSTSPQKMVFIIGNQMGISHRFEAHLSEKIKVISLGLKSYLASSVIRLIKIIIYHDT